MQNGASPDVSSGLKIALVDKTSEGIRALHLTIYSRHISTFNDLDALTQPAEHVRYSRALLAWLPTL